MISTGRFFEFVREITKTHNEEHEDKMLWEIWIHKVFDNRSFKEFKEALKNEKTAAPTPEELEETVRASYEMLNGFSLRGGAQEDGIIQTAGDDCY